MASLNTDISQKTWYSEWDSHPQPIPYKENALLWATGVLKSGGLARIRTETALKSRAYQRYKLCILPLNYEATENLERKPSNGRRNWYWIVPVITHFHYFRISKRSYPLTEGMCYCLTNNRCPWDIIPSGSLNYSYGFHGRTNILSRQYQLRSKLLQTHCASNLHHASSLIWESVGPWTRPYGFEIW